MAQSYTRQSTFADGDTITASLFNDEYNQLLNAFAYSSSSASSTGHRHDGSAGQGGNIPTIGDLDFLNKITVDGTNNRIGFFVEVSSAAVEQIRIQDGAMIPVTDSDVDLGTSSLYWKDAYIDSVTTTGNIAIGGNLTITGDLTISGDDLVMGTNTAGHLLIADGTNFNPTAVGDLSEISTVANDDVLLAVDTSGGGLKKITRATLTAGIVSGSEISNIVEDTTPQLGGDLDMNGQDIVTTSNADLELAPHGTGHVTIKGNTNSGAIQFNCESNSHGQIVKAQPHSAGVTNELLLPAGGNSTLVSLISTDTLTNKTLTAPTMTGIVTISSTDALTIPVGTTAQRPTAATGMIRFNNTDSKFEGYDGSSWGTLGGAEFAYTRTNATATAGQTTFSATYNAGYVDVYLNGVKLLVGTDFTATNGTSIVLTTGATVGDNVEILAYVGFNVANALTAGNNLSDLSSAATALTNLGITSTAAELNYVDGVTSNIQTQIDSITALTATASGALANGDTVIVNSDGTVSAISGTSGSQTLGTPAVFESGATKYTAIAYDANAQKIIITYEDDDNSDYGTAVVGTVSGTSISFGTPVVFENTNVQHLAIAYDANAQKVVIAYQDVGNNYYGTAVVGTVSGTSISFGTPVVFESASSSEMSIAYDSNAQKVVIAFQFDSNGNGTAVVGTVSGTSISFGTATIFNSGSTREKKIAYDANAQKVVIAYRDGANSSYGTAIVGTVSGTSISFGTEVVFESAYSSHFSISYDSNAQKVVIGYKDNGNSDAGTAVVGTVSGTSISFGTPVVFNSTFSGTKASAYDANAQKVVIAYRDEGNSDHGYVVVGTVSGTSISFTTPVVFESAGTDDISATYDANAQKVVIAYKDAGNLNYGTAVVFQAAFSNTNLTSENYIGISDAAYSDTATATIQIVGAVDDAQSSLTAGRKYFVQADGSLGLTAANPEVFAGTAISATKLIIKG